jgi:hypothetical protein
MTCNICFEDYQIVKNDIYTLECNHKYHNKCLERYIKIMGKNNRKGTCPYCREFWNINNFLRKFEKDKIEASKKLLCVGVHVLINSSTIVNKTGKICDITPTMYRVELDLEEPLEFGDVRERRLVKHNNVVLHVL